ncbi:MAG TPA: LEPR-XLL domain-containing protein, partial [Pirellulales bacterium]|nr:LEPR-XLL domain-containing protein [Pirellulales bacterium]
MLNSFSRNPARKGASHVRSLFASANGKRQRQRRAGSSVTNFMRLEALEPRQLLSGSPGTTATVVADTSGSSYYPNSVTPGNVLTGVAFNE